MLALGIAADIGCFCVWQPVPDRPLLSRSGAAYQVGTTWVPGAVVGTALGTKRAKSRLSKPC